MSKATRLELLEFFKEKDFVDAFELMERFGYTRGGAHAMLHWLKTQRLIINDVKGIYTITDRGMQQLIYFGRV